MLLAALAAGRGGAGRSQRQVPGHARAQVCLMQMDNRLPTEQLDPVLQLAIQVASMCRRR
jgi:hypothetical protein